MFIAQESNMLGLVCCIMLTILVKTKFIFKEFDSNMLKKKEKERRRKKASALPAAHHEPLNHNFFFSGTETISWFIHCLKVALLLRWVVFFPLISLLSRGVNSDGMRLLTVSHSCSVRSHRVRHHIHEAETLKVYSPHSPTPALPLSAQPAVEEEGVQKKKKKQRMLSFC